MRALRVVLTAPAFNQELGFAQRKEEFPVQQFIPKVCSVILSLRVACPNPRPVPISMARKCPMISSARYRFRAIGSPPLQWTSEPNALAGLV